jgi:hypothetical protein
VPARGTGTAKLGGGSTRSKACAARSSISVARSAQARGKTISYLICRDARAAGNEMYSEWSLAIP